MADSSILMRLDGLKIKYEQLWSMLGHEDSVCDASYPLCEEKYLVESTFEYPVMINGKLRFKQEYPLTLSPADIQADIVTK